MIYRFAGTLILFLLIGCAEQTTPQSARELEPRPASPTDDISAGTDDVVKLAGALQTATEETEAAKAEAADKTEVVEIETAGNDTAETKAVKTETIVMKVPGMH